MVLVTHDSSIARRAQRIGIMKNGRLSFRQPRPSRTPAARSQTAASQTAGRAATAGSQTAGRVATAGRAAAVAAEAAPVTDLQPPDLPVYSDADLAELREPGRAYPAEPDLTDLDDSDLDDSGLDDSGSLDEPDSFADSDSGPADTIRFD
jgi:hypothetical protein